MWHTHTPEDPEMWAYARREQMNKDKEWTKSEVEQISIEVATLIMAQSKGQKKTASISGDYVVFSQIRGI